MSPGPSRRSTTLEMNISTWGRGRLSRGALIRHRVGWGGRPHAAQYSLRVHVHEGMSSHNRYYRGPISDHFDGLRFFNPGQPGTDRSLRDLWRWRQERAAVAWPAQVAVTPTVPEARVETLRITMVGHATLLIQAAGLNILTTQSGRSAPARSHSQVPGVSPRRELR